MIRGKQEVVSMEIGSKLENTQPLCPLLLYRAVTCREDLTASTKTWYPWRLEGNRKDRLTNLDELSLRFVLALPKAEGNKRSCEHTSTSNHMFRTFTT